MVLTIAIVVRAAYGLQDYITVRHLDIMAKFLLASGWIVIYSYVIEQFMAWYSGNLYEEAVTVNRMFGPYAALYWALLGCNALAPQLLWFKWVRTHSLPLLVAASFINVGMWIERYVIVVSSLNRDFLPSAWHLYLPTIWDWATLLGTIGLFLALFFLFVRLLPMISTFEVKELITRVQATKGQE